MHVEKALYSYAGVYPTLVQAFAARYASDCRWINREDDARDKGLRTSKMQYLPAELADKMHFDVGTELDDWDAIPRLETERLVLDGLTEEDKTAYNALCLDDERNRWWGYDYREDLQGELTEDYFLEVARHDFAHRLAVNFAVRLDGRLIGEAVLYNLDWRGGIELGCRIAPAFAGHGYGTEAFAAAARGVWPRREDRPTLLLGALADKDHEGIVDIVAPLFDHIVVTQSASGRALPSPRAASSAACPSVSPCSSVYSKSSGHLSGRESLVSIRVPPWVG
jgi:RimJ/RimL family protein N-acetyltransferase